MTPQDDGVCALRLKSVIITAYRSENLRIESCAHSNKSVDIKTEKTPDIRLKTQI